MNVCLATCVLFSASFQQAGEQLRKAAADGDVKTIRALLADGATVDSVNSYGRTALSIAAGRGHTKVVRALLDAGADIERKDTFYRFTPLTTATLSKRAEVIRTLLQRGARGAGDALMFVVTTDQIKVVEALLTDKNISQKKLRLARSAAAQAGKADIAKLLADRIEPTSTKSDTAEKTSKKDTKPSAAKPLTLTKEQLRPYIGQYSGTLQNQTLTIKVQPGDNSLSLDIVEAGQTIPVTPTTPDHFTMSGVITIEFLRRADAVHAFKLTQGDVTAEFRRTTSKEPPGTDALDVSDWKDFESDAMNWPAFRGNNSRGFSDGHSLPETWDAAEKKNIRWAAPIPGLGLSSPAVWGDRVFVTTAVPVSENESDEELRIGLYGDVDSVNDDREHDFRLICLSLKTGRVLWQRDCHRAKPQVKRHTKSSHANPTPATNGQFVVVSFGSEGVYCYDMQGKLVWKKQLGFLDSGWFYDRDYQWGFASSPAIHKSLVFLQCDIQDDSFLVACNLETGDEKWRVTRKDIPTWSSPVGYDDPNGNPRVVVNGTREAAAYDANSGEQLWSLGGMSEIVVPTPQVTPNYVLLASGYAPIRPILAIRHGARGRLQIDDSAAAGKSVEKGEKDETSDRDAAPDKQREPFVWKLTSGGSYLPTPLVYRGYVFVVSNSGVLSCHHAATGNRLSRIRLRGKGARSFTGSPIAADGQIYVTAEQGQTFVVPAAPNSKATAVNPVNEAVLTSPAIANKTLLIRGAKHLFAISTDPGSASE